MLRYINNKYEIEFAYIEPFGGDLGSSMHKILVSSPAYEGEQILVSLTEQEDGTLVYSDNYLAFIYRDEVSDVLTQICSEVYGDCSVPYSVSNVF